MTARKPQTGPFAHGDAVFKQPFSKVSARMGRPLASSLPELPATPEGRLAGRVREYRVARGWSQADLAARMGEGWHQTTVAKTERAEREPRYGELLGLAEALGVTVEELMGLSSIPPSSAEEHRRARQSWEQELRFLELRLQYVDEDIEGLEAQRKSARQRLAVVKKELAAAERAHQAALKT